MAKVSAEAKKTYAEKVRAYKIEIEQILQHEKSVLQVLQKDDTGAAFKKLSLSDERLNLAAHYLLLNRISLSLLGIKNEAFLNDARKCCYESIIHLEDIVTDKIDLPFTDLTEYQESIEGFGDEDRYKLIQKLGFTIESVVEDFGENSKWKWSFVELEGRYTTVMKNLINFKTLMAGMDPRVDGYQARVNHLNLVKTWLNRSADRYREKYELSTTRIDDFKAAIDFLSSLRRIHQLLGEGNDVEMVKRKMDVWKGKMDDDAKRKEGRG